MNRLIRWIVGMAVIVGGCVWVMNSTDTQVNMRPQYAPEMDLMGKDQYILDTIIDGDTVWMSIDTVRHKANVKKDNE